MKPHMAVYVVNDALDAIKKNKVKHFSPNAARSVLHL